MTIPVSLSAVDFLADSTQPTELKELSGEARGFGSDLQDASQLLLPLHHIVSEGVHGKHFPGEGNSLPPAALAIAGDRSVPDTNRIPGQVPGSQSTGFDAGLQRIDLAVADPKALRAGANDEPVARRPAQTGDPLAGKSGVQELPFDATRVRAHPAEPFVNQTAERSVPVSTGQAPVQRALELRVESPSATAEAVHAALRESKWSDEPVRSLPLGTTVAENRRTIEPAVKTPAVFDVAAKSAAQLAEPGQLIATAATTPATPNQTGNSAAVMLRIDAPVLDKAWGEALGQKITWLAGDRIANAEVRLNPPELGPIRIQVSVDDDAARLNFAVNHQATRDAIEQAIPRLREMLGEQGLSLADSSVTDGRAHEREQGETAARTDRESLDDNEERQSADSDDREIRRIRSNSIVDTFV